MPLQIDGVVLDELASDPGTPVEGQIWYNTTDDRIKIYRGGTTKILSDTAELEAHTGATNNPHSTDIGNLGGGTLSELNSAISDATLIDTGDSRLSDSRPGDNTFDDAATARSNLDVYSTTEVDGKVAGLYEHKGAYDASANSPDLDTSPSGVKKGDAYTVSVAGTFFTEACEVGDVLIADKDDPTVLTDWTRVNKNISFGTSAGTACEGNDSRLSDARTPTSHASSHIDGGGDAVDGDKVEVTWTPTNYTRTTAPTEVDQLDQLTAHLAGIDAALTSMGLKSKSGSALAAGFAGSPKKITITFSTAFSDANYAVALTSVTTNNSTFNPAVESKAAGSFVINLGSSGTSNLTSVDWVATKHGES